METLLSALSEYRIWFIVGAVLAGAIWFITRLASKSGGQRQKQSSGAHSTNVQVGGNVEVGNRKTKE